LAGPSPLLLHAAEATLIHPTSRKSASRIHILHSPGPSLMSIAVSDRPPSGYYHDFLDLPIKPSGCATAWLRQATFPGERLWKARRAQLGPAEEVRQWWRRARVRQRKTALVTIPSNQPRIAEKMTIQTSDTVDEPTTQLNLT
jgi:hypothetical protein